MRRPIPAARCALAALLAAQAAAPAAADGFDAALAGAAAAAGLSFQTHRPGDPYLEAAVRLPPAPQDRERLLRWRMLQTAVQGARDAQEGCPLPCAAADGAVLLYLRKIHILAGLLGIEGSGLQATLENYAPGGVPRKKPRPAPRSPEAQSVEAMAVAGLLADRRLPQNARSELNRKALALAESLGKTPELAADDAGFVGLPDGSRRRLSAEDLRRLNSIPRVQAGVLRTLAAGAPPPPATSLKQKQRLALEDADREIERDPGTIGSAYRLWDQVDKDTGSARHLRWYAKANKFLLTYSGLKPIEDLSGKLGYVWDGSDVGAGQKAWLAAKLGGHAVRTAFTFMPPSLFLRALHAAKGLLWFGKAAKTAAVTGPISGGAARTAITAAARRHGVRIGFELNPRRRVLVIKNMLKLPGATVDNALGRVVADQLPSGYKVVAPDVIGPGFAKSFARNFKDVSVVACKGPNAVCRGLMDGTVKLNSILDPNFVPGGKAPFLRDILQIGLEGVVP